MVLAKPGAWLVGALVQNFWSFAGDGDDADALSFQYFVNYNFPSGWYLATPTIRFQTVRLLNAEKPVGAAESSTQSRSNCCSRKAEEDGLRLLVEGD